VQSDVNILGLGITDPGHIYFFLRIFDGKGLFQTPQSVGAVVARYDVATQSLRPVHLGGRRVPLDIRFLPGPDNSLRVVGTYLGPITYERSAGLFSGWVGDEDSLVGPRYHPFPKDILDEIVLDQSKNGITTLLRPMGNNALLRTTDGWTYTLHLRGQSRHPASHRMVGPDHNQSLISWPLDEALAPGLPTRWGFFQNSRVDYLETFSWMPLVVDGRAFGLATDYSTVRRLPRPDEAASWCLPLDGRGDPTCLHAPMQNDPTTVLAPRHGIKVAANRYLLLARTPKALRVVELHW
jgi:hypothetical protein